MQCPMANQEVQKILQTGPGYNERPMKSSKLPFMTRQADGAPSALQLMEKRASDQRKDEPSLSKDKGDGYLSNKGLLSLDGKIIKVEQARRSLESGSRRRLPPNSRARGPSRILKCGRGGSRARSHPSREEKLDDDRYTPDFNVSSTRRRFTFKRSPTSKNESPPSKRSARSALTRSSTGFRGREPRGREISRNVRRRETVSSRRDDYPLPRDDGHSSKDRRVYPSSQDTKEYASTSRGYGFRDYDRYSSRDERASNVFSEHVGYRGGQDRDYSEYSSGSSHRDTYERYGSFHVAPSARETYSGNNRYDDYSSSRDGYSGSRENHSSSRSDTYEIGYERSGRPGMYPPIDREYRERGSRQERGYSPMDRVYAPFRELYSSSSRFGSSSGGRGESRYESGGREHEAVDIIWMKP
ncbi:hypothetical protein A6R68_19835 [Neotoma lepida]|uniref:RBM1CTR domain-containing protein n=1 Tax=Neotoma lepida TaxID=56216 RepID=A0A1A6HJF7_NEOLE|nr:hypothetical protein A6R68_19835 [Neotoma lepida]